MRRRRLAHALGSAFTARLPQKAAALVLALALWLAWRLQLPTP